MYTFMTPEEAVRLIQDGDTVCLSSYGPLSDPDALRLALGAQVQQSGHPQDLTLVSPGGYCDGEAPCFIAEGAVRRVYAGYYDRAPQTLQRIAEGSMEGYALPTGAISQCIRALSAGEAGALTRTGLGAWPDPRIAPAAMNAASKEEPVQIMTLGGVEQLYYRIPRPNVALLRATAADGQGNITCDGESVRMDLLSMAQAVKANGGKVIVQVQELLEITAHPRRVTIPGKLVDVVVVAPAAEEVQQTLCGQRQVPGTQANFWALQINEEAAPAAKTIADRALQELQAEDRAYVGRGISEAVANAAAAANLCEQVTFVTEAGAIGGAPATGRHYGAAIGAKMLLDSAKLADMLHSGNVQVVFASPTCVDSKGNACLHLDAQGQVKGAGSFTLAAANAKKVVFCLELSKERFCEQDAAITFSAEAARQRGQQVLYITDQCVFELTEDGLKLAEVFPGADARQDILPRMGFVPAALD